MVKVIASSLRKGNVVDQDGKLYVILIAENIHPGKGNSVTQLDMRRISDGADGYRRDAGLCRGSDQDRRFRPVHRRLFRDGRLDA